MSLQLVLEEEAFCHGVGGSHSLFFDSSADPDSQIEARPGTCFFEGAEFSNDFELVTEGRARLSRH
jgi:hypothetical protein